MKDRTTLGHCADTAETAALTMADERATERIIEALEYEEEYNTSPLKVLCLSYERCKHAAIERVRRALGNKCAEVTRAYLNHKDWKEIGIPRTTFQHALKKLKIIFQPNK